MSSITDVYLKLAELAKLTIRDYASDFYMHDAKVLFGMKRGDVALWAPRESGSCFVIVARQGIGNKQAPESFQAYHNAYPGLVWQVIDTTFDGKWHTYEASFPADLIEEYQEAARQYEESCKASGIAPRLAVSELHM